MITVGLSAKLNKATCKLTKTIQSSPGEFELYRSIVGAHGFHWNSPRHCNIGQFEFLEPLVTALQEAKFSLHFEERLVTYFAQQTVDYRAVAKKTSERIRRWANAKLERDGYTLWDYQLQDAIRQGQSKAMLNCNEVGLGKAQPDTTPIRTPAGWRALGSLEVGDLVQSDDGKFYPITAVYPQGELAVSKVSFHDGSSTSCCDEHLWSVRPPGFARPYREISTAELRHDLRKKNGSHKWFIPASKAWDGPTRVLSIDPWVMGVLLGDGVFTGTNGSVSLANSEDFIYWQFRLSLPCEVDLLGGPATWRVSTGNQHGKTTGKNKNPILNAIKALGLWGCNASTKFVPRDYLESSKLQRMRLLQGLLDTDGSCWDDIIEYGTVSSRLGDDFVELVESLGGTCKRSLKSSPQYTYLGERRTGQPYHRFIVSLPPDIQPFTLPRKAQRYSPREKYNPYRAISSIEPAGRTLCRCISVASPTRRYVCERYIVTHNTIEVLAALPASSGARVIIVATKEIIRQNWVVEIPRWRPDFDVLWCKKSVDFRWPRRGEIVLTHYEALAHLPTPSPEDMYLVGDEFHLLSNPHSQRTKMWRSMALKVRRKGGSLWGLTGTPMEDKPDQLWTLLVNLGIGDKLFSNNMEYKRLMGGSMEPVPTGQLVWVYDITKQDPVVRERLAPHVIRHEIDDVRKDLPPAITIDYPIEMTDRSLKASMDAVHKMTADISDEELLFSLNSRQDLAQAFRMKAQLARYKAPFAIEIIQRLIDDGKQVVVFSAHVDPIEELSAHFNCPRLHGQVPDKERDEGIKGFVAGKYPALFTTIRTGGTGQNFQNAHHSVIIDEEWDYKNWQQLRGRTRRGEQKETCWYHRLVADHIVDQRVAQLLSIKKEFVQKTIIGLKAPEHGPDEFWVQLERFILDAAGVEHCCTEGACTCGMGKTVCPTCNGDWWSCPCGLGPKREKRATPPQVHEGYWALVSLEGSGHGLTSRQWELLDAHAL